ncbi:hypothetical protein PC129_g20362 [Phytophthora cactorum]|uniref:Uncharacterized protein n=1 Tax=Phytophthora cactorum TaxID=29920 RepID=A0A8T1H8H2_9STRA|nr:hypothetical protein PC113_g21088 [Phytophthora cactorum]KAG2878032.1 hypothetical protein PC114_g23328 [Phytophthora cactorum]KAG2885969.1 hypothetical protein PC115_g20818 [Phytophthora cactorum]KAG3208614.1 hypothetical protein PC129_g20362 [Phytophthora cactorum]
MDIPESCDVMLGMPWLDEANPIIDWTAKSVRPHPRPDAPPAVRVRGRRCRQPRMSPRQRAKAQLRDYFTHGYQSEVGVTRLVRPRELQKLLNATDNEFCFMINASDKPTMTSKAAAAWKTLEGTQVYPLLLEFRDVFRSELPSVPPTRQGNMDASIDISDSTLVHRKQFPFSREQREAILQWTAEMR